MSPFARNLDGTCENAGASAIPDAGSAFPEGRADGGVLAPDDALVFVSLEV